MAHTAVKRARRASTSKNTWLLRGLLVAVGLTVIAVIVFALIIGFTGMGDGPIHIVNQLIKLLAIFMGVRAAVPRGSEGGALRGALVGLLYMGLGVALYALLSGQQMTLLNYLMDVCMGIAAGGLSGMLLSSLSPKVAKK